MWKLSKHLRLSYNNLSWNTQLQDPSSVLRCVRGFSPGYLRLEDRRTSDSELAVGVNVNENDGLSLLWQISVRLI